MSNLKAEVRKFFKETDVDNVSNIFRTSVCESNDGFCEILDQVICIAIDETEPDIMRDNAMYALRCISHDGFQSLCEINLVKKLFNGLLSILETKKGCIRLRSSIISALDFCCVALQNNPDKYLKDLEERFRKVLLN